MENFLADNFGNVTTLTTFVLFSRWYVSDIKRLILTKNSVSISITKLVVVSVGIFWTFIYYCTIHDTTWIIINLSAFMFYMVILYLTLKYRKWKTS